jgi:hypothetical protein
MKPTTKKDSRNESKIGWFHVAPIITANTKMKIIPAIIAGVSHPGICTCLKRNTPESNEIANPIILVSVESIERDVFLN